MTILTSHDCFVVAGQWCTSKRKVRPLVELPLTPIDFFKLIVFILFGIISLFSFLYGTLPGWIVDMRLFRKNKVSHVKSAHSNELWKEPTKVIGGLGVLMVSLIANNAYIYGVALFIGGLLIASERFMITLAAIFNSKSEDVISKLWVESQGTEEVKERQSAEAEKATIESEKQAIGRPIEKRKNTQSTNGANRYAYFFDKIRASEAIVLQKIESRLITNSVILKPYVRIGRNGILMAFDAAGLDAESKKPIFGVEIKFQTQLHERTIELQLGHVRATREKAELPMVLALVFDKADADLLESIRHNRYRPLRSEGIAVVYYQTKGDNRLEVINVDDLNTLMPNYFVPF